MFFQYTAGGDVDGEVSTASLNFLPLLLQTQEEDTTTSIPSSESTFQHNIVLFSHAKKKGGDEAMSCKIVSLVCG